MSHGCSLKGEKRACLDGFTNRVTPGCTEGFQDSKVHDCSMGWRDCILCSLEQMVCLGGNVLVLLLVEWITGIFEKSSERLRVSIDANKPART